ncbi:hypothetical protein AMTRI_Chr07g30810 [Amborella trichopoda]
MPDGRLTLQNPIILNLSLSTNAITPSLYIRRTARPEPSFPRAILSLSKPELQPLLPLALYVLSLLLLYAISLSLSKPELQISVSSPSSKLNCASSSLCASQTTSHKYKSLVLNYINGISTVFLGFLVCKA